MNRENIIRMAQECQIIGMRPHLDGIYQESLERFAALVAAYVRETEFKPDWNNYRQGLIDGAAEEREACATICDVEAKWSSTVGDLNGAGAAVECGYKIRARGGE